MATPAFIRSLGFTLPSLALPGATLRGFARAVRHAQRVLASRRLLAEMEPRMLADIGITHTQAIEEARRAPWDIAPLPRRR